MGDNTAAIRAFEQLSSSGPVSGARASGAVALADLYLERGETDKAEAVLVALQPQAPPYAELAYVLGRAQKAGGKNEAAIFSYREALRLQPLLLQAHIEIGGMYGELGEPELAAKAFLEYEKAVYRYAGILEDPAAHPIDKQKICDAFSFLPDDRAAQALLGALDDKDRDVRFAATDALGEVGSAATVPRLRELAAGALDADPQWAKALANAAAKIEANPAADNDRVGPALLDAPPEEPANSPDAGK